MARPVICATLAEAVAMEIPGRSQIATTADLYGHVLEEAQRDAASRVAVTLFGKGALGG